MKVSFLVVLALFLAVVTESRTAHAIAACNNNFGFAPRKGVTLPKRARLVAFSDMKGSAGWQYSATIAGKQVKLKRSELHVAPYYMTQLEVDSDATGTLVVYRGTTQTPDSEIARYEVRADAKLPKDVTGTPRRFTRDIRHSTVKETYDTLAIDIGDTTPAVMATIRIRRDANASWSTFDVPVNTGDWMDTKTTIRIGQLGCTSNYTVALLEQGVELAIVVTLADGSKRELGLPAGSIKLPKTSTNYKPSP